ncbi:hypothetical protein TRIUR3_35236 [Triticum urartu]|uniref:Uncharacterized protein n=1 Tax=Triticum urartu TaxID=4572 RepID=M7ZWL1_TRIUA|nr:hypothetical protein TRIUR3_35236 [Triticum urartu]
MAAFWRLHATLSKIPGSVIELNVCQELGGQTTRSGVPPPDPVPVGTLRVTANPTAADMVASAGELAPAARLSTPLQDPLLPCSTTTSGPTRATGSPKAAAMVASTDDRSGACKDEGNRGIRSWALDPKGAASYSSWTSIKRVLDWQSSTVAGKKKMGWVTVLSRATRALLI